MRPRRHLSLAASGALLACASAAEAYCPCYTASSSSNDHNCGVEAEPGTNPTDAEWQPIFDLVSQGPAVWGSAGPSVSDIGQGCGKPEAYHPVPARFPCELLKAIAMAESGWTQFCVPESPPDQVGGASRTIISFDCGYGVSQVTSGMHEGESPSFDRSRVASDPTYNLAAGTQILASKWAYTECVGDNQPTVIEHWYTATWAYNGLAYVNNPNNPNYDANRGVYNPSVGGSCPYQEKVFGRMEYTGGRWPATALAYPNPGDIGNGTSPPELPEPSCASPTDCSSTRSVHETICDGSTGGSGGGAPTGGNAPTAGNGPVGGAAAAGGSGAQTALGGATSTGPAHGGSGQGGEDLALGATGDDGGCACVSGPGAASHGSSAPSRPVLGLIALVTALGVRLRTARRRSPPNQ